MVHGCLEDGGSLLAQYLYIMQSNIHPEVIEKLTSMVGWLLGCKDWANSSIGMDPRDQFDLLSKYGTTSALKLGSHETIIHFTGHHQNLSGHLVA